MAFVAVLDTSALFPALLCDTLLRLADADLYQPLWSGDILEELRRSLIRAGVDANAVDRRLARMRYAFREAEVKGYEHLVTAMSNHPKDRHVLAAAVRSGAGLIVTFNVSDFPPAALDPHEIEAVTPDSFLLDQLDLAPELALDVLRQQMADYSRPPMSFSELLNALERAGAPQFAREVRRCLP